MNELLKLIEFVRARPFHFLGKLSLERLSAFMSGASCLYYQMTGESTTYAPGFDKFVHEKYHMNTTHNATSIIDFFSASEEEAFYTFFDLLDEFLAMNSSDKKS